MSPRSGTPPKTATISRINLKFAFQITPETTNEISVPVCIVAMKKNANNVAERFIPAVSAKHVSVLAKLATSGTNTVPEAKMQTENTCVSTKQLRRETKKPPTNGMYKFNGV